MAIRNDVLQLGITNIFQHSNFVSNEYATYTQCRIKVIWILFSFPWFSFHFECGFESVENPTKKKNKPEKLQFYSFVLVVCNFMRMHLNAEIHVNDACIWMPAMRQFDRVLFPFQSYFSPLTDFFMHSHAKTLFSPNRSFQFSQCTQKSSRSSRVPFGAEISEQIYNIYESVRLNNCTSPFMVSHCVYSTFRVCAVELNWI